MRLRQGAPLTQGAWNRDAITPLPEAALGRSVEAIVQILLPSVGNGGLIADLTQFWFHRKALLPRRGVLGKLYNHRREEYALANPGVLNNNSRDAGVIKPPSDQGHALLRLLLFANHTLRILLDPIARLHLVGRLEDFFAHLVYLRGHLFV